MPLLAVSTKSGELQTVVVSSTRTSWVPGDGYACEKLVEIVELS